MRRQRLTISKDRELCIRLAAGLFKVCRQFTVECNSALVESCVLRFGFR